MLSFWVLLLLLHLNFTRLSPSFRLFVCVRGEPGNEATSITWLLFTWVPTLQWPGRLCIYILSGAVVRSNKISLVVQQVYPKCGCGSIQKGYESWWLSINHSSVVEHWWFKPGAFLNSLLLVAFHFPLFLPCARMHEGIRQLVLSVCQFVSPVKNF